MDSRGLQLIEKHLRSKLEAKGTMFFPWRKTTGKKTEQIIDRREVAALGIRLAALDIAFRLRGDYAPKKLDFDPDEGVPIKVINTSAIPCHGH